MVYLGITSISTLIAKSLFKGGGVIGTVVEIFLYSILNAYYCYEYKTALLEIDLLSSLGYFET